MIKEKRTLCGNFSKIKMNKSAIKLGWSVSE
jgi:hypothetical protein